MNLISNIRANSLGCVKMAKKYRRADLLLSVLSIESGDRVE